MNDNLSKIAGGPTRIIQIGDSYEAGMEYGGNNYPVFKGPAVSRIVVLEKGRITELEEYYQDSTGGPLIAQSVIGNLSSDTGDIGQNIDGLDVPAGTILVPTRVAFSKVVSGTAVLEIHLLHQQAQTALKVG
jgi:hypothetical protein